MTTNTTESLDEILEAYDMGDITKREAKWAIQQEVLRGRVSELESLKQLTTKTTHIDAYISDVALAQDIRIHTNALIEHRLNELNTLLGGESNE